MKIVTGHDISPYRISPYSTGGVSCLVYINSGYYSSCIYHVTNKVARHNIYR